MLCCDLTAVSVTCQSSLLTDWLTDRTLVLRWRSCPLSVVLKVSQLATWPIAKIEIKRHTDVFCGFRRQASKGYPALHREIQEMHDPRLWEKKIFLRFVPFSCCEESHIVVAPITNVMLCTYLRFTTWLWGFLWTGGVSFLLLLWNCFIFSRFAYAPDCDVVNPLWYCLSITDLGSFCLCSTFQIGSLFTNWRAFFLIFLLFPSVAIMEEMMGVVDGFSNQWLAFCIYCKPHFLPVSGKTLL